MSEAQLQERKDQHGECLEDGTFSGRTLTEAIVMQREAKQQKIEDDWKQIKQGKLQQTVSYRTVLSLR